jgi:UDP-N-acetylmuramoyl-tripeptide--D-alanyl-D-alanine ligase
MLAINRHILFWLYLWQLKEYHLGRFLAHFETAKGKSIFINPLFIVKLGLVLIGPSFYFWFARSHSLPLDSPALLTAWIPFAVATFWLAAAVFLMYFIEAAHTVFNIFRSALLHPVITKKSLALILLCHVILFGAAVAIFNILLGELRLIDQAIAAFLLVMLDVLLPCIVGLVVLVLQPITIWQKNRILAKAAARLKNQPDLAVIGITGSYGKSVTKELLASILACRFSVLKTEANQNTEIGIAQAILTKLRPEHEIFVCEIGAVHKGRIRQIANAIKPSIGILTGIDQQHLGIFGSQQNIVDAKFELPESLPSDGTAILNWQSKFIRDGLGRKKDAIAAKNVVRVNQDIFASDIKATVDRLLFAVNYNKEKIILDTNARGAFMVEPILLAAAAAAAAGMNFAEVARILSHTDFTPFNIKSSEVKPHYTILESTYSANPDGVLAHLDYLKLFTGKKAIVMPCLIELGSASKDVHFEIGKRIGQMCDLAIITTKERFSDIKRGTLEAGMNTENIFFHDQPLAISELIKTRFSQGTVLLEGRSFQPIIDAIKKG